MRRAGLAVALGLSLPACVATQKDMLDLSEQQDQLKSQIGELKKTVGSMQANQADLSVQIKELREELLAYSETVKASMGDMTKLGTKLDELGSQLAGKVSQLGQTIGQAQQRSLEAQQKNAEAIEAQRREAGGTQVFVTAEKRLESQDFAAAAEGFEDYLKRFPQGPLADTASYDLGLAYYGLKQWEKAGRQFALVLDRHPKSGRTPAARLHYARCLIRLKRNADEARSYLESIAADFPRTPEAKEASAELKRLARP